MAKHEPKHAIKKHAKHAGKVVTPKEDDLKEDEIIIEFDNYEEVEDFRKIAEGKEFLKVSESLRNILSEEVREYEYEHEKNLIAKWFSYKDVKLRRKFRNQYLETRRICLLRKTCRRYIEKYYYEVEDFEELLEGVKKLILANIKIYKNKNK